MQVQLPVRAAISDLVVVRLLAVSDSGSLDIKELVDNYHILVQHSLHGEELLDAFNKLDTNKDGYLSLPELKVSPTLILVINEYYWM
mgnify:CR=1 FL=1